MFSNLDQIALSKSPWPPPPRQFFFHNIPIQAEKCLKSVWIGVNRPPPPPPPLLENVQIQAEKNVPQTIWTMSKYKQVFLRDGFPKVVRQYPRRPPGRE
jgi:hypothetical protein